jgi:hypothetical protein
MGRSARFQRILIFGLGFSIVSVEVQCEIFEELLIISISLILQRNHKITDIEHILIVCLQLAIGIRKTKILIKEGPSGVEGKRVDCVHVEYQRE